MRVSWPDVEGGQMLRERGVWAGLQEEDTVWFLESSQVEQVCVLVESVSDGLMASEQDREIMEYSRNVIGHVESLSPGDNDKMTRVCHSSVCIGHQPACDIT